MSADKQRAARRRLELLLVAQVGIMVNVEGGRAATRDLHRLHQDGLVAPRRERRHKHPWPGPGPGGEFIRVTVYRITARGTAALARFREQGTLP